MVPTPSVHPAVAALKQNGDKAYAARDYAASLERYSEALEGYQDAVVLSNRSATHAQRRRFDKAIADADKGLTLAPRWFRLHHRRGHALFHLGRLEEAVAAFATGLELNPQDRHLLEAVAKLRDYTEEVEQQAGAETPWTHHAEPSTSSAPAVTAAAKQRSRAGAFSKATTGAPSSPGSPGSPQLKHSGSPGSPGAPTRPPTAEGDAFASMPCWRRTDDTGAPTMPPSTEGDAFDSMPCWRRTDDAGNELSPSGASNAPVTQMNAEEYREKGNEQFRAGNHSKAVRFYDQAIRADSSDARSWANRAAAQQSLLEQFGRNLSPEVMRANPYFVNALSDLNQSLLIDPTYVKAWARKGQLLSLASDPEEAKKAYEMGLKINPQSPECQAGLKFCR